MTDEVYTWLDELGVAPSAPLETVHERPWSTVLRVPTADGDLYLKQPAPVQAFEPALTAALAARWPDRLPEVVGVDLERAWLLLRDGGTRLIDSGSHEPFATALRLYGELQVAETAQVDEFLSFGVPDVRLPLLTAAYEPFFDRDHGLEPDEAARLRALAPRYRELCAELDALGFPSSIQHDDLHDANVFVREGRVAIFDWGDSSVSHPLASWLKVLRLATDRGLDPDVLRDAYLDPWTSFASLPELRDALRLAVPVASFAYALQFERQLSAMTPEVRPRYAEYMTEQLRRLLTRLTTA